MDALKGRALDNSRKLSLFGRSDDDVLGADNNVNGGVPAEALFEKDNKTYCYTSYDKENDALTGEVEVKTGLSDGKNVEIVSGLNEGDQIWYKYANGLIYNFVR